MEEPSISASIPSSSAPTSVVSASSSGGGSGSSGRAAVLVDRVVVVVAPADRHRPGRQRRRGEGFRRHRCRHPQVRRERPLHVHRDAECRRNAQWAYHQRRRGQGQQEAKEEDGRHRLEDRDDHRWECSDREGHAQRFRQRTASEARQAPSRALTIKQGGKTVHTQRLTLTQPKKKHS